MRFTFLFSSTLVAASVASRQLSESPIAGYDPKTSVTDHNAIDLDQKLIQTYVASATTFPQAKKIYEEGAHSKSYARVTFNAGVTLPTDLPKGTGVTGVASDGTTVVTGALYKDASAGDNSIKVQYTVLNIQESYVNCQVGGREADGNVQGCFAASGSITIDGIGTPFEYAYSPTLDNDNGRTIKGFSTGADTKMRVNGSGNYYVDFQKFFDYYGRFDYADHWIQTAFSGTLADFPLGWADFSGKSAAARAQAIKKGTSYMSVAMYVIRELEDALDDCERGCSTAECNDDSVHALDEAVAFYTGSLEGIDGSGSGVLLHALADKRCPQFNTCNDAGTSKINDLIFDEFNRMKNSLIAATPNCAAARTNKERIVNLLFVPLIQGTIRYAHILGEGPDPDGDADNVEGAVFAASVLPMIHSCSPSAATTIYNNMKVGAGRPEFQDVKAAFEGTYNCLKITCEDVGGYWNSADKVYWPGAEPCGSGSQPSFFPAPTPTAPAPTPTAPRPTSGSSPSRPTASSGLASSEKEGGLSTGGTVGVVLGSIAAMALIAFVVGRERNQVEFKGAGNSDPASNV